VITLTKFELQSNYNHSTSTRWKNMRTTGWRHQRL